MVISLWTVLFVILGFALMFSLILAPASTKSYAEELAAFAIVGLTLVLFWVPGWSRLANWAGRVLWNDN